MIRRILSWSLLSIGLIARAVSAAPTVPSPAKAAPAAEARAEARVEIAVFAMGCFWCGETQFEQQPGVISVISGYCGGAERNPTYEQVSAGVTGHYESVQVTFDPARTSYEKLLDLFWHGIDPTQGDGQFCDLGAQYRSVVFVANEAQRRAAEASKREVAAHGWAQGADRHAHPADRRGSGRPRSTIRTSIATTRSVTAAIASAVAAIGACASCGATRPPSRSSTEPRMTKPPTSGLVGASVLRADPISDARVLHARILRHRQDPRVRVVRGRIVVDRALRQRVDAEVAQARVATARGDERVGVVAVVEEATARVTTVEQHHVIVARRGHRQTNRRVRHATHHATQLVHLERVRDRRIERAGLQAHAHDVRRAAGRVQVDERGADHAPTDAVRLGAVVVARFGTLAHEQDAHASRRHRAAC
jgi:peptide-methionine (S)-S-oxide reductase